VDFEQVGRAAARDGRAGLNFVTGFNPISIYPDYAGIFVLSRGGRALSCC